jgi:hypothetical protein
MESTNLFENFDLYITAYNVLAKKIMTRLIDISQFLNKSGLIDQHITKETIENGSDFAIRADAWFIDKFCSRLLIPGESGCINDPNGKTNGLAIILTSHLDTNGHEITAMYTNTWNRTRVELVSAYFWLPKIKLSENLDWKQYMTHYEIRLFRFDIITNLPKIYQNLNLNLNQNQNPNPNSRGKIYHKLQGNQANVKMFDDRLLGSLEKLWGIGD